MSVREISDGTVSQARTKRREVFIWDSLLHGFGVRVTSAGTKSYVFQYRLGGRESRTRRYTIGRHGSPWSATDARAEAERLAQMVARKQDPMTLELRRRRQAKRAEFGEYIDRFSKLYLEKRWKRSDRVKSLLERHAVPMLRHLSIRDVDRQDIARIYDRLANTPSVAHQLHATLRKMFRWAVSRGDLDRSPLDCVEGPPAARARERYLTDEELALVWRACDVLKPSFVAVIRLLILTGQRRGEVAGMSWQELDHARRTWVLPASRTKNSREHVLPLGPQCVTIFDGLTDAEDWSRCGLIFASDAFGERLGFSKIKARLDREIKRQLDGNDSVTDLRSIAPWRFHDLRRSLATGLQRQGARFEVIEAILNHKSGERSGVAGVYQRYGWHEEMRVTLDDWGAHIDKIVTQFAPKKRLKALSK